MTLAISGKEKLSPLSDYFLRVNVYKIAGMDAPPIDDNSRLDGTVQTFELDNDKVILKNLTLGAREFVLEVVKKPDQTSYRGRVRHLVGPGAQTVKDPVVLKKIDDGDAAKISVEARVTLAVAGGAVEPNQVTYEADIKPLLASDRYKCLTCHTAAGSFNGGVVLSSFPFSSTKPGLANDPKAIVARMISAVKATGDSAMPPPSITSEKLTSEEVALLEKWAAAGLPLVAKSDVSLADLNVATVRLRWSLSDLDLTDTVDLAPLAGDTGQYQATVNGVVSGNLLQGWLTVLDGNGNKLIDDKPLRTTPKLGAAGSVADLGTIAIEFKSPEVAIDVQIGD